MAVGFCRNGLRLLRPWSWGVGYEGHVLRIWGGRSGV